jgi:hypothetical protein
MKESVFFNKTLGPPSGVSIHQFWLAFLDIAAILIQYASGFTPVSLVKRHFLIKNTARGDLPVIFLLENLECSQGVMS